MNLITWAGPTAGALAPQSASDPLSGVPGAEPNISRLESLAARFEADHPGLADTLRQLGDLLVKAGI